MREVDRDILAAPARNLPPRRIRPLNHHLNNFPDVPGIIGPLNLSLPVKQHLKPLRFSPSGTVSIIVSAGVFGRAEYLNAKTQSN
jgi:hypothetical protein